MDREIVEAIRLTNEACMALMTLMAMEGGRNEAAELVAQDAMYSNPATCMAIANFALSAINTLAAQLEIDPLVLVQTAALSAAEYAVDLEKMIDKEEEE